MKAILCILGLLALIFALLSAWFEKNIAASISTIAFLTFTFLGYIDKLSKFKAGFTGFEAETKEVVAKAQGTIEELQMLGKEFIFILLSLMKRNGRLGRFTVAEEEDIKNKMIQVLERLDFSKQQVNNFIRNSDFYKFDCFDYASKIMRLIHSATFSSQQKEDLEKFSNSLEVVTTPDILQEFIKKHDINKGEILEWLEDYFYYVKNGTHRRPQEWANAWEMD